MCDGASSEERAAWALLPAQKFRYLNQSSCFTLPRVDNAQEYQVGLSGPEKCRIYFNQIGSRVQGSGVGVGLPGSKNCSAGFMLPNAWAFWSCA